MTSAIFLLAILAVVVYLSLTKVDVIEAVPASATAMTTRAGTFVLVVTNKVAATAALVDAVRERAREGSAEFFMLVPNPSHPAFDRVDSDFHDGELELAQALPALAEASGAPVGGRVAHSPNAYDDIVAELDTGAYDEVILETPPSHVSHWLHVDLAQRVAELGYPLRTITATH